uniref:Uncharacterized protein n=1 Tax=Avena sativa TaxID=4498 RepID=A0ACD5Y3D3_AVESA
MGAAAAPLDGGAPTLGWTHSRQGGQGPPPFVAVPLHCCVTGWGGGRERKGGRGARAWTGKGWLPVKAGRRRLTDPSSTGQSTAAAANGFYTQRLRGSGWHAGRGRGPPAVPGGAASPRTKRPPPPDAERKTGGKGGNGLGLEDPKGQSNTDYLLKAATATPGALWVQVADPNQDHRCWERPEDMDTPRAAYKVTPQSPGSDVAGETAATLAAASLVFRARDPAYSSRLLAAVRKVFDFADRYRGSYSDSLSSVVSPFYTSYSGYNDELLWAAAWLHLASSSSPSSNSVYMSYISANGGNLGGEQDDYTISWDDKRVATKVLLSKVFLQNRVGGLSVYKSHADHYICSLVPGASGFQSQYTPGGLLFKEGDSNMQYVTSTAFLLLAYAKDLASAGGAVSCGATAVAPSALVSLAKRQVDYILGANPAGMSYMVGFGPRYPRRVHHRGASMPSVRDHPARIGCDDGFQYLHSSDPDHNVLVGAVVGGPGQSDAYTDSRDNYAQAEPSSYTNAPPYEVVVGEKSNKADEVVGEKSTGDKAVARRAR